MAAQCSQHKPEALVIGQLRQTTFIPTETGSDRHDRSRTRCQRHGYAPVDGTDQAMTAMQYSMLTEQHQFTRR